MNADIRAIIAASPELQLRLLNDAIFAVAAERAESLSHFILTIVRDRKQWEDFAVRVPRPMVLQACKECPKLKTIEVAQTQEGQT